MTVEELIQALQAFPPKSRCVVNMSKNELANGCEIKTVAQRAAVKRSWSDNWNEQFFPGFVDEDETQEEVIDVSA